MVGSLLDEVLDTLDRREQKEVKRVCALVAVLLSVTAVGWALLFVAQGQLDTALAKQGQLEGMQKTYSDAVHLWSTRYYFQLDLHGRFAHFRANRSMGPAERKVWAQTPQQRYDDQHLRYERTVAWPTGTWKAFDPSVDLDVELDSQEGQENLTVAVPLFRFKGTRQIASRACVSVGHPHQWRLSTRFGHHACTYPFGEKEVVREWRDIDERVVDEQGRVNMAEAGPVVVEVRHERDPLLSAWNATRGSLDLMMGMRFGESPVQLFVLAVSLIVIPCGGAALACGYTVLCGPLADHPRACLCTDCFQWLLGTREASSEGTYQRVRRELELDELPEREHEEHEEHDGNDDDDDNSATTSGVDSDSVDDQGVVDSY